MKKIIFTLVFFISCFFHIQAQYVFDGNEGCTEYSDSFQPNPQPQLGSSTCSVNEVYGVTYEENGINFVQVGLEHGNSGQSNFRVYLNTDCDESTGQLLTGETANDTPTIPVQGAEYMINFTTGNNHSSTVYEWNGTDMVPYSGTNLESILGTTCDGVDAFAEFRFPVNTTGSVINTCDDSVLTTCSTVEITTIVSNAGNSGNSNYCSSVKLLIDIRVNTPPDATFTNENTCFTNDSNTQVAAIALEPSTMVDPDFGNFPGTQDTVSYTWTSLPVCLDCFTNASGQASSADSIKTYFVPDSVQVYTITLELVDKYGCSTDTSTYQQNITPALELVNQDTTQFCAVYAPPLPVELFGFSVADIKDGAELSWSTASEFNNKGFYVQKSKDGQLFEDIGWVDGYGTTTDIKEYRFVDTDPFSGANHYRLVQEDDDGQTTKSNVVYLNNNTLSELTVYPNPVGNHHSVRLSLNSSTDKMAMVKIFSVNGKLLKTQELTISKGNNNQEIDVSNLDSGMYSMSIQVDDNIKTLVLIK